MVLLVSIASVVSSMHVDKYGVKLKGKNNIQFVEKFAFGEDVTALVKVRVRFENPYQYNQEFEGLKLLMVYDRHWYEQNLGEADCKRKEDNARFKISEVKVKGNGEWSSWYEF